MICGLRGARLLANIRLSMRLITITLVVVLSCVVRVPVRGSHPDVGAAEASAALQAIGLTERPVVLHGSKKPLSIFLG